MQLYKREVDMITFVYIIHSCNDKKLAIQGWVVIFCFSFAMLTEGKTTRVSRQNESVEGEGRWLSTMRKLKQRLLRKRRNSTQCEKIPLVCDSAPGYSEFSCICNKRNLC